MRTTSGDVEFVHPTIALLTHQAAPDKFTCVDRTGVRCQLCHVMEKQSTFFIAELGPTDPYVANVQKVVCNINTGVIPSDAVLC